MLTKKIKAVNFEGVDYELEAMFNMTRTELARFEASKPGGLEAYTDMLVRREDKGALLNLYEELVQTAYGKVSADGYSFVKDAETTKAFVESNAYDELMMELLGTENAFNEFVRAIIPKGITMPSDNEIAAKTRSFKNA